MATEFEPRDDLYIAKVEQSFARQAVMGTLQVSMLSIEPGRVKLAFPYQQQLTQQHGFIHAGIVSTVLDSACGYAAFSLMSADAAVLTIEFKVNLLAPAKGTEFIALGSVKKAGKNILVTEGEMFAVDDSKEKLVATMVATVMAVYDKPGISN